MLIRPGKAPAFKRELNKPKSTNGLIEQVHITVIITRFISIIRTTIEIKITHNNPIDVIRHLDIHKPIQEISFTIRGTGSIDVCEKPMSIIMIRTEINGDSKRIMENKGAKKQRRFPNDNSPT